VLELQEIELRVRLADARCEQPEATEVRHDLREHHLAEAAHERRGVGPGRPERGIPAEALEDRRRPEAVAQQHRRVDDELLPLPELGRAHLLRVQLAEREDAEGDVPRLVGHHAGDEILDQRLVGELLE